MTASNFRGVVIISYSDALWSVDFAHDNRVFSQIHSEAITLKNQKHKTYSQSKKNKQTKNLKNLENIENFTLYVTISHFAGTEWMQSELSPGLREQPRGTETHIRND